VGKTKSFFTQAILIEKERGGGKDGFGENPLHNLKRLGEQGKGNPYLMGEGK